MDNIIENLQSRFQTEPFFHLTGSKEEKEYIRENGCTYKCKFGYGGEYGIITDKSTKQSIEIPLFRE